MPENPTEVATPPVDTAPAPDPEKEALLQQAARDRQRAELAEQRSAYAAGAMAAATARVQTPPVDILDRYAREDLTLSPDDKKLMLDRAMRERAAQVQQVSDQRTEQRLQAALAAQESKFALNLVTAQRPELADPANAPKFGAAITRVKMEADARGEVLDSGTLAQRAGNAYDQMFPKPAGQRLPFTERATGDMNQMTEAQMAEFRRTPQSELEKRYGRKAGSIQPPIDFADSDAVHKLNMEYLHQKNGPLFKKGALSSLDLINATREE